MALNAHYIWHGDEFLSIVVGDAHPATTTWRSIISPSNKAGENVKNQNPNTNWHLDFGF
jgi:hypothetical protein